MLEGRLVPATFFVTNTGDNGGTNPAAGAGTGTLRQAIVDVNADTGLGTDTIKFAIPGTGVQTISPLNSGFPAIVHPVFIDGTTQPGFAGKPLIEIEGSAGIQAEGLDLEAGSDGSIIRDLVINRFGIAINIFNSNYNQILGNYLGTDYTGTLALGNDVGVSLIGGGNVIGGTTAADRNVISGNSDGIDIGVGSTPASNNNVVEGNCIGTDASGTQPLGNVLGVAVFSIGASHTLIGGTTPGASNLIAFNSKAGVNADAGVSTRILGNGIFANGGLGIDVGGDGVTSNTPNGAQNFPVLQSAVTAGGVTTVEGTLNSTANTTFRLEFFADPAPDPSGFGQGQTFLGAINVHTDGNGNSAFTALLSAVPVGQFLSATSTGPAGTSEFAQDIPVLPAPPPVSSPAPQPPVLTAFFAQPPKGEVAVGGFVLDPAGQLRGLPLVVIINWGDGTQTFTGLFSTPSGFEFFLPQTHKKPKGHKQVTVHVEQFVSTAFRFVDVVAPFVLST
jgi:hypothetical protein